MADRKWCILYVLFSVATVCLAREPLLGRKFHVDVTELTSITFLLDVNNTYKHIPPFDNTSYTCATTVKTDSLYPNTPLNKSEKIMAGNCDNGSLLFTIHSDDKGNTSVVPAYYSSFIGVDNSWTCTIDWNYRYRLPSQNLGTADESLLPGCFTTDTFGPEGIQVTSYWFYILDWELNMKAQPHNANMEQQNNSIKKSVASVTFLVAVNQTETKCLMTSKTPPLRPGVLHNQTEYIYVGKCDYGALDFNITTSVDKKGEVHSSVYLIFHSHDIEDASPPSCNIPWDYSYKVPSGNNYQSSLLPGCYTEESREGFHMTYYWFYVLDWMYD